MTSTPAPHRDVKYPDARTAMSDGEWIPERPYCLPGCGRLDGHDGRDPGACMKAGAVIGAALPPSSEFAAAAEHSKSNPTHILGPYEDRDGATHIECEGSTGPYERPNCDFDTAKLEP